MTTEEKAKAYDEALERAKNFIENGDEGEKTVAESIFYGLIENEDERIRKAIIEWFKTYNGLTKQVHPELINSWVAWLEKQGEKNVAEWNDIDEISLSETISILNEWLNKKAKYEYKDAEIGKQCIDWLKSLKPIKHWKPNDKVEPKFKVGDWVVTSDNEVKQIEKVTFGNYWFTDESLYDIIDVDNKGHLWIIQDAKDGDALVASDGSIFIFKEVMDCGCKHYIALTKDGEINVNDNLEHFWEADRGVKPATREQRNLLFFKMKESGYEWNDEKKEVKKIKKAPQKFMVGDTIKYNGTEYKITEITPNGYKVYALTYDEDAASLISFSAPAILVEQNPTWSEEDIRNLQDIDSILFYDRRLAEDARTRLRNFLKSIKDRVQPQPKQEWSEEDEKFFKTALWHISYSISNGESTDINCDTTDWLKSLKERVGNFDDGYKVGFSAAKYNQWKPSEEQMKVLDGVKERVAAGYWQETLQSLIDDLKNL